MGLITALISAAPAFESRVQVTPFSKIVGWVVTVHMVAIAAILVLPAIGD
jgi:hypothetical protein